jgi:heavy metal sensor kinase
MNIHSFRFRLALWYFIAFFISVVGLFVSFYYVTDRLLKSQTDREITSHADSVVRLVSAQLAGLQTSVSREQLSHEYAQMPGMLIAVYDIKSDQLSVSQSVDGGIEVLKDVFIKSVQTREPLFIDQQISFVSMRIGIFPVTKNGSVENMVLVAHPVDVLNNSLAGLVESLLILLLIVGLPAVIGAYLISGSALSPLTDLARRLQKISSADLSQRLPDRGTQDEIGELTETFNSLLSRLEGSFDRERQFIGDVAHELRTPLSVIKSSIEAALSKQSSNAGLRQVLKNDLSDIDRLSLIISDVLDLAWAESGEIESQFKMVNFSEITKEVEELLTNLSSVKKIHVVSELAGSVYVSGSPKKLFRAIYNLVDNAVKYTPAKGKIGLALHLDRHTAVLEISNSGPGISVSDLPHIFRRFHRVGEKKELSGSGLGLSISKSIIEAHHGTLSVRSSAGKMTTFTVRLPVVSESS